MADEEEVENGFKREKDEDKDKEECTPKPFLPRLTHLHPPPVLAVRLLERITRAPFAAHATLPSSATLTSRRARVQSPRQARGRASSFLPRRLRSSCRTQSAGCTCLGGTADGGTLRTWAGATATATQVLEREREKDQQPETAQVKPILRKAPRLLEDEDLGADGEAEIEVGQERVEKVELRRVGSVGAPLRCARCTCRRDRVSAVRERRRTAGVTPRVASPRVVRGCCGATPPYAHCSSCVHRGCSLLLLRSRSHPPRTHRRSSSIRRPRRLPCTHLPPR
ncbi:hypothetical protein B0H19DRAFT_239312 [Mycena capillaripes]|nr:hypothetical protein B0H19DRAFT_239312 [Mycena capillaripes]